MGGLVLVVVAALLARRRRRWAAYLALTAVGGVLLNQLLKRHFVRPRPDLASAVLGATGYSFPSGHAMSATIVLGALGYLAARSARSWAVKSAAFSAFATLALAIGVSRLYLGVHWASDVVAGFAAGRTLGDRDDDRLRARPAVPAPARRRRAARGRAPLAVTRDASRPVSPLSAPPRHPSGLRARA